MQAVIAQKLKEIEEVEGGRILYTAESGSRAWGFASLDSDYDVRFLAETAPDPMNRARSRWVYFLNVSGGAGFRLKRPRAAWNWISQQ
jgi:nucleotidyltransferase, predicted